MTAAATLPLLLVLEREGTPRAPIWDALARSFEIQFVAAEPALAEALAARPAALVVLDDVEARDALALRDRIAARGVKVPFALMTSHGDEDSAVEALRGGFSDYIVKRGETPRADLLEQRLSRTLDLARLQRENELLHRAIEESQARLFSVYDSLDDVIMQIDQDCRVHSLNRSAAALANIEPKDGVGRICWQLFDFYPCEERAKKESCHIYRTFLEGETIRGEREDPKTKDVHQYMTFITTLKDHDYVVYRETDITEKRRLEAKIAAALRSLGAGPEAEAR
jgi:FixJ family two-component response regulator